jgi:hypothetical protein
LSYFNGLRGTYDDNADYAKPGVFIAMSDIWRPRDQTTSGYVWLPMVFEKSRFTTPWRDAWSVHQ